MFLKDAESIQEQPRSPAGLPFGGTWGFSSDLTVTTGTGIKTKHTCCLCVFVLCACKWCALQVRSQVLPSPDTHWSGGLFLTDLENRASLPLILTRKPRMMSEILLVLKISGFLCVAALALLELTL